MIYDGIWCVLRISYKDIKEFFTDDISAVTFIKILTM